jgi:hypothetical protein
MTTLQELPTSAVPPPCSAEHPQHQDSRKDLTNNFKNSRCQFTYSDGRRCGNERAPLCVHHGSKQREPHTKDAPDAVLNAPELQALCSDLTTATNINRALAQVFLLTAQGRISQKQAVAFGYLSQLLLQTVPGIRSEFVSAFGYAPWEQKLKSSLESNHNDDPDAPGFSRETSEQPFNRVVEPKASHRRERHGHQELSTVHEVALSPLNKVTLKASLESNHNDDPGGSPGAVILSESSGERLPTGCAFAGQESQRRISPEPTRDQEISPEPAPVNKARLSAQSLRDGLTPDDWESLYHRGRDLLAGKYSVTPEGRREAQALDTDLELIKPPAAKMPKGARASVIEHMKRWIAQRKAPTANSSAPASIPRALNLLGHPIPTPASYDKMKSPVAPTASSQPAAAPPDSPASHRPKKPRGSAHVPASEPPTRPTLAAPAPEPNPDPLNSTAHTTAWYAPASWSKNRTPDPFPSRNEKLQRGGRGMSNSKSRHLHHLNSRVF